MNHKKIKKQINKINSFFDSISDDNEVSSIEKDLLLSYVRKLYESIIDNSVAPIKKEAKAEKAKVQKTPSPVQRVVEEKVDVVKEAIAPTPIERKPFERPEPVRTPEPVTVNHVAETVAAKVSLSTVSNSNLSETMKAIFEKKESTELSQKLSSLPIKDLTKAISINEKIFTIQELFGGNQDLFNSTLSKVNGLSNYEEAMQYLVTGVAEDQKWDENGKIKKAEKFVKLVQRRFS